MSQEQKLGLDDIMKERANFLLGQLLNVIPAAKELAGLTDQARQEIERQVAEFALSIRTSKLDKDQLESFFKKPYYLAPIHGRSDSWNLIIPKFIDIQIGYLERTTPSFNVFLINRYTDWVAGIPEAIKKQLNWKTPPELILEGEDLLGSKEALNYAWQKYKPFLGKKGDDRIRINPQRAFDLIAALIKDGVLPFTIKPIPDKDLVNRKMDWELRDYQIQGWNEFKKYSAAGFYYPPSTGKTVIGMYALTHITPPHLVVVPSTMLKEQWEQRIKLHTDLTSNEYQVLTYQSAIKNATQRKVKLLIIDEHHHIPANTFVKLALIQRDYTIGLSATPYRQDEREEYIFALTGKPIGLSWDYFKKIGLITNPDCHVWIVKSFEQKLKKLDELLQDTRKTIIYSDSIEIGKTLGARFKIPFVFGVSKNKLETVMAAPHVVVSRVGDEGVSLPELERVIEVSWLYASRRQELQRATRLYHGLGEDKEHHILFTEQEYLHDRERLFSLLDKGWKINLHSEGISEKVIEGEAQPRIRRSKIIPEKKRESAAIPQPQAPLTPTNPLLSSKGVQNAMPLMKGTEQNVFKFLIENDTNWITDEKLAFHLGLTGGVRSLQANVRFGWMQSKDWIERKKIEGKMASRTRFREITA